MPLLGRVLGNRGIADPAVASRFLNPQESELHDPYLLAGMATAVDRIRLAIARQEKIWVYGDYDVDGITSTAMLVSALAHLGAKVGYYIPNRQEEGYGLNPGAISEAHESGVQLIISVDCGIASVAEVSQAAVLGIDMIVTDHHEPFDQLPPALAVLNPKQSGCTYPGQELAGVGVAFKLVQALLAAEPEAARRYLDLVALGTVADIVPLQGENRAIVRLGLGVLNQTENTGLAALLAQVGYDNRTVDADRIAYLIAPRINATGRVGDAKRSVELFLTDNPERAKELAAALESENRERQAIEADIVRQALELLPQQVDLAQEKVIVLAAPGWHTGVIGIVASRLTEQFTRPTVLISLGDGEGKGSARSIPGFNLFAALEECRDHLRRFGGHAQAAGLAIAEDAVAAFRRAINEVAERWLRAEDMLPAIDIDGEVSLADLTPELWEQLVRLQPYGAGNPSPTFLCRRLSIIEGRRVGARGEHMKLRVGQNSLVFDVIGFGQGYLWDTIANRERVDLAFTLENNVWNGRESLQLVLKDIKNSQLEDNLSLRGDETLWVDEFLRDSTSPVRSNGSMPVYDHRYAPDKLAVLQGILKGGRTLIGVNSREQAVALAYTVQSMLPAGRTRVGISHGRMNPELQERVWAQFAADPEGIMITAGAPEWTAVVPGFRRLVLFYPVFRRRTLQALAQLVDSGAGPGGLYLLYTEKEVQTNVQLLPYLLPERNTLARLYLLLRQMKKGEGPIALNPTEIASHFGLLGEPLLHAHTIALGLEVFAEMGLVRFAREEEQTWLYLPAPPQQKLNIENSTLYAQWRDRRDEALEFLPLLAQGNAQLIAAQAG